MKIITHSTEETKKLATQFAGRLKGGELIALVGQLGSGKTTFVRGVVEALGSTARVKSPTFTLMNIYPTSHKKISRVVHADFYRTNVTDNIYDDLGLSEELTTESVLFIEWPDEAQTKEPSWTILFEHGVHPSERVIILQPHGTPHQRS
ncbi:MAG: tRNA (adenosine(37)-N6)-threonylcarbamoyltransferase complex ATPase subunit type 1 TsaE [Patescibacteria group bacterium]